MKKLIALAVLIALTTGCAQRDLTNYQAPSVATPLAPAVVLDKINAQLVQKGEATERLDGVVRMAKHACAPACMTLEMTFTAIPQSNGTLLVVTGTTQLDALDSTGPDAKTTYYFYDAEKAQIEKKLSDFLN